MSIFRFSSSFVPLFALLIGAMLSSTANHLHKACLNQDLESVNLILQDAQLNVNARDCLGQTSLHNSIFSLVEESKTDSDRFDLLQIIDAIMNHPSFDGKVRNKKGLDILSYSFEVGNAATFERICMHKDMVGINDQDAKGNTFMHRILRDFSYRHYSQGRLELIKILSRHSNLTLKNRKGFTPFHIAVNTESLPIVQFIHDHINAHLFLNEIDLSGNTALHLAISKYIYNSAEDVPSILSIIEYLCRSGRINGNIRNKRGHTPFHLLVGLGSTSPSIVQWFIERADAQLDELDGYGYVPFHKILGSAFENKKMRVPAYESALLLFKSGRINVYQNDRFGDSIWHLIRRTSCKEEVLNHMINVFNVDVNHRDDYGRNALYLVAEGLDEAAVRIIARHKGPDPNITDINGNTILHRLILEYACDRGRKRDRIASMIRLLLECFGTDADPGGHVKLNINHPDRMGDGTLIHAIVSRAFELAMDLLKHREVDLNLQNHQGNTALILAILGFIQYDHGPYRLIVDAILDNPTTNANLRDHSGEDALKYAMFLQQPDIFMRILDHPSRVESDEPQYERLQLKATFLAHSPALVNAETIEIPINRGNLLQEALERFANEPLSKSFNKIKISLTASRVKTNEELVVNSLMKFHESYLLDLNTLKFSLPKWVVLVMLVSCTTIILCRGMNFPKSMSYFSSLSAQSWGMRLVMVIS